MAAKMRRPRWPHKWKVKRNKNWCALYSSLLSSKRSKKRPKLSADATRLSERCFVAGKTISVNETSLILGMFTPTVQPIQPHYYVIWLISCSSWIQPRPNQLSRGVTFMTKKIVGRNWLGARRQINVGTKLCQHLHRPCSRPKNMPSRNQGRG